MANVQQNYNVGESFNTLTQDQLSALDSSWKWDHRTLSGFKTVDGAFIEPGGLTSFDTQTAQVSGVWDLDKTVSVYLSVIGSGSCNAVFTETNTQTPLGDNGNPYNNTTTLGTSTGEYMFITYYGARLCADVTPDEGCTITQLKYQYKSSPKGGSWYGGTNESGEQVQFFGNAVSYVGGEAYLSVYVVRGGILTYYSNTNTINPDLA